MDQSAGPHKNSLDCHVSVNDRFIPSTNWSENWVRIEGTECRLLSILLIGTVPHTLHRLPQQCKLWA
jgi:hypothetical protein